MGGKSGKTIVYDAGSIGGTPGSENLKNIEKYIQGAFHKAAINGVLNKDKFNEALACLEDFNIKRLRDTPLGVRLFRAFDEDKTNSISYDEFSKGLRNLLQDKNNRIFYTFKVYDHDNDNKISRKEFIEFHCESWMAAFRILGEKLQSEVHSSNLSAINNWATEHLKEVREYMDNLFSLIDKQRLGYIEIAAFREWILNTDINSITAQFDNFKVEVPINLYNIDSDAV